MQLTFIVSIDPVKGLPLLNILVHSLNLQTQKNFDVVFYNQTLLKESEIISGLQSKPQFSYRFFPVERFFGEYPLWDLYSVHQKLLDADLVGDYFMSMHMEEFFDADYVENVTAVLERARFDILLGNLSRTPAGVAQLTPILETTTSSEFDEFLRKSELKKSPHWAFSGAAGAVSKAVFLKRNVATLVDFGFRTQLEPDPKGYCKLRHHYEDLYFMSKTFAVRHNWFLPGRRMYFEDIQLCDIPHVCELGRELRKLTDFPNYFNRSRMYHAKHPKFYYQFEDAAFTDALLAFKTEDAGLRTLQKAVRNYRGGVLSLTEALEYSRNNSERSGTQNLNYKYHMEALQASSSETRAGLAAGS